jgi:hypothetical protein
MPRVACRLVLEVTEVRVQRLQEISQADAQAEGPEPVDITRGAWVGVSGRDYIWPFKQLWDSINAKRAPWASNPWVWVVSFRRVP